VLGLLAAFGALLYIGPDVDRRRWRFLTPGSVVAVVIWIVASAAFSSTRRGSPRTTRRGARCGGDRDARLALATALALLFGAR
jgi:Predicted membrane protein